MPTEINNVVTLFQGLTSETFWGVLGTLLGTLLGTILGWILNNLSNRGKLYFYVRDWKGAISSFTHGPEKENISYYSYSMELEVYNSSNHSRVVRDLYVIFLMGNREFLADVPSDDAKYHSSNTAQDYKVDAFNVPAKEVFTVKLFGSFNNESIHFQYPNSYDKIYLQYRNEKNKIKRIKLTDMWFKCAGKSESEATKNG